MSGMVSVAGVLSLLVVVGYVAVPVSSLLVWYTLQRRDRPSGRWYTILTGGLVGLYLTALASDLVALQRFGLGTAVSVIGGVVQGVFLPLGWVAYTLAYTGRGDTLTRRRLAAIPALLGVVVIAAGVVSAELTRTRSTRRRSRLRRPSSPSGASSMSSGCWRTGVPSS